VEILTDHLEKGLYLILMLSLPATLLAAFIGLIIGILQAVTQVQEQTISAAPKILAVFMLIILGGGVMMDLLSQYLRESTILAFQEIPLAGTRILPPQQGDERKSRINAFFKQQVQGKTPSLVPLPLPEGAGQKGPSGSSRAFSTLGRPQPKKSVSEQLYLKKR